jgi:hypothetical protein
MQKLQKEFLTYLLHTCYFLFFLRKGLEGHAERVPERSEGMEPEGGTPESPVSAKQKCARLQT